MFQNLLSLCIPSVQHMHNMVPYAYINCSRFSYAYSSCINNIIEGINLFIYYMHINIYIVLSIYIYICELRC